MTSYETFLKHRRIAERAIGRVIVETVEAAGDYRHLLDANGRVLGTDVDAAGCVFLSGVSRARVKAAMATVRARGDAPTPSQPLVEA